MSTTHSPLLNRMLVVGHHHFYYQLIAVQMLKMASLREGLYLFSPDRLTLYLQIEIQCRQFYSN